MLKLSLVAQNPFAKVVDARQSVVDRQFHNIEQQMFESKASCNLLYMMFVCLLNDWEIGAPTNAHRLKRIHTLDRMTGWPQWNASTEWLKYNNRNTEQNHPLFVYVCIRFHFIPLDFTFAFSGLKKKKTISSVLSRYQLHSVRCFCSHHQFSLNLNNNSSFAKMVLVYF